MHHFNLLELFVQAAVAVDKQGVPVGRAGGNPEGWFALDEVLPEPLDAAQEATVHLDAAVLEDMGLLKRRVSEGRAEFRATASAYRELLGWPQLHPDEQGGTEDRDDEEGDEQ